MKHVPDRSDLDQAAGVEHADLVAQPRDGAEVVADEQDGRAEAAAQVADEIEDGRLDGHVEASGRLVHDQQLRLGHQRHRDDDALLLAAGEFVRIARHHRRRVGHADFAEHGDRAIARAAPVGDAMQQRHFHQLFADVHDWVQARHGVLVDHRDAVSPHLGQGARVETCEVSAFEEDAAVRDLDPGREIAHRGERRCRLAAAGFADEAERATDRYGKAYIGQDRRADAAPPAMGDADILEGEDVCH